MKKESGQSLIELVVAIGIFVIVVSALVFLIFSSYIAGRLASEINIGNFLAEEGLEVARSIRDSDWTKLTNGNHGLDNLTGNWVFFGTSTDASDQLNQGQLVITVEDLSPPDPDRKKIISRVSWQFTEARPQEVKLVTYLTNWAGPMPPYLAQLHYRWRNDDGGE